MTMTMPPRTITPAVLECVVMPNGEVICGGQTLGWVRTLGGFLRSRVGLPEPSEATPPTVGA
jgi:hypothetical protein